MHTNCDGVKSLVPNLLSMCMHILRFLLVSNLHKHTYRCIEFFVIKVQRNFLYSNYKLEKGTFATNKMIKSVQDLRYFFRVLFMQIYYIDYLRHRYCMMNP